MREVYRLRRQIESATDLLSVVRTMKALAAVNIRQYETAVRSLRNYMETVELGFQIVLENRPELIRTSSVAAADPVGAIVFGSDQGMCGSFNERIAEHARRSLHRRGLGAQEVSLLLVGHRMGFQFDDSEFGVRARYELPSAVEGVASFTRVLTRQIEQWRREAQIERVLLFYNEAAEGSRFTPTTDELLPIDRRFLERLADRDWQSRCEPMYTVDTDTLFGSLVDEYLYVGIFRACAESLASENAARLMSMQSAQRNISERLDEIRTDYRRKRQSSITAELLDIVGGYEALSEKK